MKKCECCGAPLKSRVGNARFCSAPACKRAKNRAYYEANRNEILERQRERRAEVRAVWAQAELMVKMEEF